MKDFKVQDPFFQVDGKVVEGFESVGDAFVRHFRLGQETNAQCCVYVGGKTVVDIWGTSREARTSEYDGDSIQLVFSNSKTVSALALAMLVDRELISYDDKVTKHWPEFAEKSSCNGIKADCGNKNKQDLTIADVLRHEAGMSTFQGKFKSVKSLWSENIKKNEIGEVIEKEVCTFSPETFPGTREYHSFTRDFIMNEVFRRVEPSGKTIGEFVKEEFREKRGLNTYIGVDDKGLKKNAKMSIWGGLYCLWSSALPGFISQRSVLGFSEMVRRAVYFAMSPVNFPWPTEGNAFDAACPMYDDETILRGEVPSVNGMCSARALAKLGDLVIASGSIKRSKNEPILFSKKTYEELHSDPKASRDYGFDVAGLSPSEFTKGGINYTSGSDKHPDEPERAKWSREARKGFYGWQGFGGSVLQWKPDGDDNYSISFAYTPTLMAWYDPLAQRAAVLQEEVVRCVEAARKKNKSNPA